jgi:hypothetical protein
MPNNKRLLELALTGLEVERQRIESEIVELRRQLGPKTQPMARGVESQDENSKVKKRHQMSAAGRRKMSLVMKRRWAARRRAQKISK